MNVEIDIHVYMPPIKEYMICAKIISVERAKPNEKM